MPTQLSKFVISASCKDYVHPWTDSCVSATAGLGLHAVQESFRIYSTLAFVTLLVQGKKPSKSDVERTIRGILQSTAFLSWSAFGYSMLLCSLRRALGNFNILTVSFLPSFLSALSGIVIEKPSRRTLLCLYVSNIATETLFRMGVWRGYFTVIPRGEVYIFAASMTMLLYYYRSEIDKKDSIFKIIRFVVGSSEEHGYQQKKEAKSKNPSEFLPGTSNDGHKERQRNDATKSKNQAFGAVREAFIAYKRIIGLLKSQGKHPSCPHSYSCAHYFLMGGAKMFSIGVGAQLAMKLLFQIKRILRRPKLAKSIIFRKENLYLASFLGGFAGIYRLVSCSMRRSLGRDSQYSAIPAGLLASTAFFLHPDNTVALYVMWKALQILWNSGVEAGTVPEVKWFVIALYCFSTAVLFHAAIIEPQNLRPSYWKFLHNLSGGRIATMARGPLDQFGLGSSESLQKVLRSTFTTDKNTYSF